MSARRVFVLTCLWSCCAALPALPASEPAAPASAQEEPVPAPAPTPEPPAEPPGEAPPGDDSATVLDKIGTFRDIEDLDLGSLLSVSSEGGQARTIDDAPLVVSVVTEEDIRRVGATTLQEVVETLLGFEVVSDSLGRSRLVVRGQPSGTGSAGVLVLVNRQRLNEAIHGGPFVVNLQIPVDNIKKIEVMRGPGAASFGPGAYLAVLNITTEAADTFRKTELTVGGGSFESFLYNFRYGTTYRDVSLTGFLQFSRTAGAALGIEQDDASVVGRLDHLPPGYGFRQGSFTSGESVDDRKSVDAYVGAAWRSLVLNFRRKSDSAGGYIGLYDILGENNRLSTKQLALDLTWARSLSVADVRVTGGFAQNNNAEFLQPLPAGFTVSPGPATPIRYPFTLAFPPGASLTYNGALVFQTNLNTRRFGAEASADRRIKGHALSLGAGLERESTFGLNALSSYDPFTGLPFQPNQARPDDLLQSLEDLVPSARRTIASAYVQDTWDPHAKLGLALGLRAENRSDFGTAVMPRLGAVWRLPRGVNVKLNYARGERLPSFLELFYTSPAAQANARLEPSTLDSFEGGLLFTNRSTRLWAGGFLTRERDVIGLLHTGGLIPERFVNLPGIDNRGLEAELSREFGTRSIRLRYTFQDPVLSDTEARVPDVPQHLGYAGGLFELGRYLTVTPSLLLRGPRARAAGDTRAEVDGYVLANLDLQARNFHRSIEAFASVHNLFDRHFLDPAPFAGRLGDYPQPGITFLVKVKYRLGP